MKKSKILVVLVVLMLFLLSACDFIGVGNSEPKEPLSDEENLELMDGFWMLTGIDGEISESIKSQGIAVEIDGQTMDTYVDFETENNDSAIVFVDDDTFQYKSGDETFDVDLSFETRDGYNLMVWAQDGSDTYFEKMDDDLYYLYKGFKILEPDYEETIYIETVLSDSELEFYITDVYWYDLYYLYPGGDTLEMNPHTIMFNSYSYTGTYETEDGVKDVTWDVYNGELYITHDADTTYYYPISYAYDAETGYEYLYWYDLEEGYEGCAWVFYHLRE